jgi:exosortase
MGPLIGEVQTGKVVARSPGAWLRKLWSPLVAFGLLWWVLFNELRVEWAVNPQYSYGFVVPLLCLGLLFYRWRSAPMELPNALPSPSALSPGSRLVSGPFIFWASFCLLALPLLPLRLLLEATPGWRVLLLIMAALAIGLTLLALYTARGPAWARHFAFPICFILVAVPWPHTIEIPIIQGLTQANATLVIEVMGVLGIPAVQHGNLIEVGAGTVGIDEACSGIRSFQSGLMIALFLGEFFRFRLWQRLLLVPAAFLVAFFFNLCRTSILTWLAATKGLDAISQYHDQAGVTILLACTAVMWVFALILKKLESPASQPSPPAAQPSASPALGTENPLPATTSSRSPLATFSIVLLLWLLFVQAGVELWYASHEHRSAKVPEWTLNWPPKESSFREVPVSDVARQMLSYDQGHAGVWNDDSVQWQMFYFRWFPGRLSLISARGHNPSVCLVAAGKELRDFGDNRSPIALGPIVFPFRRYEVMEGGRIVHVFHCLWEEHAAGAYYEFDPNLTQLQSRLLAAWHGRRNLGQRSLEFMLAGIEDPKAAEAALIAQLQKIISIVQ